MKAHFKSRFGIAKVKPRCETQCASTEVLGDRHCTGSDGIVSFQYLGQGNGCQKFKTCQYGK
jgi:hypothetical protein